MGTLQPFLENPAPDFDKLIRVLKGEQQPDRVHVSEASIDDEMLQAIQERFLGQKWTPQTKETEEAYYQQKLDLYYRLGYESLLVNVLDLMNHPPPPFSRIEDTAELSRGLRAWACEGWGLIRSWKTFEQFPWEQITVDYEPFEINLKSAFW